MQTKERARVDIEAARPQLLARQGRIRDELASLGKHDWAGTYYEGDGLGVNVTLMIAPGGGAAYTWSGCIGLYDLNHGSIAGVSEDGIDLELAFSPDLNNVMYQAFYPYPCMSSRWVPVTWGKEHFLIPDSQMIAFCNAVNDGSTFLPFPHRIEGDDWHRKVERSEDPPRVPPAYRPFLLLAPLDASILEVSEPTVIGTFADEKTPQYLVSATVGIGSEAGLLPGMLLYAQAPNRGLGQVLDVDGVRATVGFRSALYDAERDTPRKGWKLSTLRQKAR